MSARPAFGLALETATERVGVAVVDATGVARAVLHEDVGHGHTRRLTPMVGHVLAEAGVTVHDLAWVASDVGPGSFTGVRVGLATASALAMVAGARRLGASSLTSLAHAAGGQRQLLVTLVGAGRRDLYAGFHRVDARGRVRLIASPRVDTPAVLLGAVSELQAVLPDHAVRFVGPGAGRERAVLEDAFPGSTVDGFRHDGLSALDLAAAAVLDAGPGAGLPTPGRECEPVYVRPAQAEEKVRHRIMGLTPPLVRDMRPADLPVVDELEHRLFGDPWPQHFFLDALSAPEAVCRVAERKGEVAGYLVATILAPTAELQNVATAPEHQRGGVARALLDDLVATCRARGVRSLALEVRASNAAAQTLYRAYGFRVNGLRRGYYESPEEDALLMEYPC